MAVPHLASENTMLVMDEPWQPLDGLEVGLVDGLNAPRLHQITEIEEQSFPPCERLGPHLMQQQASLRTSGLLLAEVGASVGGFLLFSRTGASGLITKLAVSPAFRRRGIGSALMRRGVEELERPTRKSFLHEIQLHVDPARTEARHLYESFGFKRQALLPAYYTDGRDCLLMRRILNKPATDAGGLLPHNRIGGQPGAL